MIEFTTSPREGVRIWDAPGQWQAIGRTADGGRISVVRRLTGFGDGDIFDTETGMYDRAGKWHLATNFDIRDVMGLSADLGLLGQRGASGLRSGRAWGAESVEDQHRVFQLAPVFQVNMSYTF